MALFDVNARPSRWVSWILSSLLFLLAGASYLAVSSARKQENPQDKLTPSVQEMATAFYRTAAEPDRNDQLRLWVDTWASGKRFVVSVVLSFVAVLLGLHMGLFPYVEKIFVGFVLFFDKIPALALLPILFIVFGLGELSKIALIVLGVYPTLVLDTYLRTRDLPREQITKAQTLGASNFELAYSVALPQILPGVLDTLRLNFKAIILFLIAGESLAATVGLGYRIFVVRRYIAMDIIIPYVIWMSLLALLADVLVRGWIRWRYPWREGGST